MADEWKEQCKSVHSNLYGTSRDNKIITSLLLCWRQ